MYYEETVINGIIHCRYSPYGKWQELDKKTLCARIKRLEEKLYPKSNTEEARAIIKAE